MEIQDILSPERVACDIDASSKKRALEYISTMLASSKSSHLMAHDVCESLMAREKLGSTGIGAGVAIPHGRVANADKTLAAFIRLHRGIDYDAVDDQVVDLIFALLVPEESTEEHLHILAELAEMFSNDKVREKLRESKDSSAIIQVLCNWKSYR